MIVGSLEHDAVEGVSARLLARARPPTDSNCGTAK